MEVFGGAPVIMVSCGDAHTLVLTARARVWSCGFGGNGRLGHGDGAYKLNFWPIEQEVLGGASIVAVAAGSAHSTAVTAGSCRHCLCSVHICLLSRAHSEHGVLALGLAVVTRSNPGLATDATVHRATVLVQQAGHNFGRWSCVDMGRRRAWTAWPQRNSRCVCAS